MWKRSSIMEAAERGCCGPNETETNTTFAVSSDHRSPKAAGGGGAYSFQPYAYPKSALSDWERVMCKATLEDYRRHFDLKIGVYVQGLYSVNLVQYRLIIQSIYRIAVFPRFFIIYTRQNFPSARRRSKPCLYSSTNTAIYTTRV